MMTEKEVTHSDALKNIKVLSEWRNAKPETARQRETGET
jgi:hypothetical protein